MTLRVKNLILNTSKYLVYEFDYFNMTGLHWAVKRNQIDTVETLLKYKSYIDRVDLWERSALFYAIQNKNPHMVFLLLKNNANPWSSKDCNYKQMAENHTQIKYFISKFRIRDMTQKFLPPKERKKFLETYLTKFVKQPVRKKYD